MGDSVADRSMAWRLINSDIIFYDVQISAKWGTASR